MELGSGLDNVKKIMDMETMKSGQQTLSKTGCYGIDFDNVTFNYTQGGKDALSDVDIHLEPGSLNAFVGPSGAGKTTAVQLLGRYWDVSSGTIKIGGVPVTELQTENLSDLTAFVFQDVFLLEDTLLENIRMGTDATEEQVRQAAKAAQKTAQATVKASQKAAQAAKATAKATVAGVKAAVKATIAAVKAIIAAVKGIIAAIAAGGWVAVVVIIVLCLVALIAGSVFGIFFSGEDSGTGMSMQTAVQEINADYDAKMEAEKNSVAYDNMEISGGRAVWKDVLAVYAVKTNTDKDNPQEVATMDESKKQLLSDIFWEMNSISSRSESHSETEITETDDGNGNIVQTETTVTKTTLYITVSHLTVDEMADLYGFNEEQREYLAELLKDKNNSLWAAVLYGIRYSDDQIVTVALSQVGNVGGEPYWSWYGFGSRVEWCACFVSWCADQCGYIDTGVVPKYAGCVNGVQWFKDRGQWIDGSAEPVPGMIIFFDWDNKGSSGPQDGQSDHTGIVQKVENGIVYTVEGNSGDSCRVNQYSVGHYEILGYGVPNY